MCNYNYYIDFSNKNNTLTFKDIQELNNIQESYRPIERVEFLIPFKLDNRITADEFEFMTGLPYDFAL